MQGFKFNKIYGYSNRSCIQTNLWTPPGRANFKLPSDSARPRKGRLLRRSFASAAATRLGTTQYRDVSGSALVWAGRRCRWRGVEGCGAYCRFAPLVLLRPARYQVALRAGPVRRLAARDERRQAPGPGPPTATRATKTLRNELQLRTVSKYRHRRYMVSRLRSVPLGRNQTTKG